MSTAKVDFRELHCCYLLKSCSQRKGSKGRTYIGYTVNPKRRIRQHNGDLKRGGAHRTKCHRPWKMVLLVYGFSSAVQALQFEWSWQNPDRTKYLKASYTDVRSKRSIPTGLSGKLSTLKFLLNSSPWCSLPLTLVKLDITEYMASVPRSFILPPNVQSVCMTLDEFQSSIPERVRSTKTIILNETTNETNQGETGECEICRKVAQKAMNLYQCLSCNSISHVVCLAMVACALDEEMVPYNTACPKCGLVTLWAEVVRAGKIALAQKLFPINNSDPEMIRPGSSCASWSSMSNSMSSPVLPEDNVWSDMSGTYVESESSDDEIIDLCLEIAK